MKKMTNSLKVDTKTDEWFECTTWDNYVEERKKAAVDAVTDELATIKKILDETPSLQGLCGSELQDKYDHQLPCKDSYDGWLTVHYSWRSWGKLMAAYMNSKKGKLNYCYMDFYMPFKKIIKDK